MERFYSITAGGIVIARGVAVWQVDQERMGQSIMHKQWKPRIFSVNGTVPRRKSKPRWRFRVRNVVLIWMAALAFSWLAGLGAVKLIEIVREIFRLLPATR